MGMFRYLKQHWVGVQPLWHAFVLNLIVLGVLVLWSLGQGIPWLQRQSVMSFNTLLATTMPLLLLVLIWQVAGLWRGLAARQRVLGGFPDSWMIYIGLLGYLWLVLIAVFDLSRLTLPPPPPDTPKPATQLSSVETGYGQAVLLEGSLEFGVTQALEAILQKSPEIRQLLLDSPGGYIGEARGLMRLVRDFQLSTHVQSECYSACTLIFVSSDERTVGPTGSLGFHQYSMKPGFNTPWINPEEQQLRDRTLMLQQGVAPGFIERAYAEPHTSLWRPAIQELLDSGIVQRVVPEYDLRRRDTAQPFASPAQ